MTDLKEKIQKNICYIRKIRGMTQMELGIEAGSDASHIGKIERGKKNIIIPTLEKIAQALNVSPCILVCEDLEQSHNLISMTSCYYDYMNQLPEDTQEKFHEFFVQILSKALDDGDNIWNMIQEMFDRVEYKVTAEEMVWESEKKIVIYGIQAIEYKAGKVNKERELREICTNSSVVDGLAKALSNHQVSLGHFYDVVEDFCINDYKFNRIF